MTDSNHPSFVSPSNISSILHFHLRDHLTHSQHLVNLHVHYMCTINQARLNLQEEESWQMEDQEISSKGY